MKNTNEQFDGLELYRKAKRLIPGGTQLLSKRPEMFAPEVWPAYYSKAKGYTVWDLAGKPYIDMSIMGIGAAVLGYGDPDVDHAVLEAIQSGVCSSLNCPEEVELAEELVATHPWAQMVRYARSGGEAVSLAVRLARAATKRDIVYFSGYHGWTDWYLAANLGSGAALDGQLMPGLHAAGIPRALKGTSLPFLLTEIDKLKKAVQSNAKDIAAFVIEPARGEDAPPKALAALRELANELGVVLIFDEITSGFRASNGGIHLNYGVNPDVAVFAKGMANGYAMSAVIGKESIMQAAQSTFVSSTNWTERIGPTAALATIRKFKSQPVVKHLISIGDSTKAIWKRTAEKHRLDISISGISALPVFSFNGEHRQSFNTIFTIEMLKLGFLGFRVFKPSFAHTQEVLVEYESALNEVFGLIAKNGPGALKTPLAHTGFSRLTKE